MIFDNLKANTYEEIVLLFNTSKAIRVYKEQILQQEGQVPDPSFWDEETMLTGKNFEVNFEQTEYGKFLNMEENAYAILKRIHEKDMQVEEVLSDKELYTALSVIRYFVAMGAEDKSKGLKHQIAERKQKMDPTLTKEGLKNLQEHMAFYEQVAKFYGNADAASNIKAPAA